jgi:hypothetical protein
MRRLPQDSAGRPVPYFVAWVEGKPDFRVMDSRKRVQAHVDNLCFTCGQPLTRNRSGQPQGTFVVGPMCVVNLVSAEPPSHVECAEWSAMACPFLTNADKERRKAHLPDGVENPGGVMIERNPGVTALVASFRWFVQPEDNGSILFRFRPHAVTWMAEGKRATTGQVLGAIETGINALTDMAAAEDAEALDVLAVQMARGLSYVPLKPGTTALDLDPYPNIRRALRV